VEKSTGLRTVRFGTSVTMVRGRGGAGTGTGADAERLRIVDGALVPVHDPMPTRPPRESRPRLTVEG